MDLALAHRTLTLRKIAKPTMMLLSEAQARLKAAPALEMKVETVSLAKALGRIAARDVSSGLSIPPADNSAMDGFAVRSSDLVENSQLIISQRLPAGSRPEPLLPGSTARIFTGANIPLGADTVVIQENCAYSATDIGETVTIHKAPASGANIRPKGQDILCGATVVRKGQRLNAIDLSLLASIGVADLEVFEPLTVAIFSTGDELAEPGQALKEGQIYNSNRPLLIALCAELGYQTVDCGIVADTLEATKQGLLDAASKAHIILSSGGVSVGEEDHIKPAIESVGALDMWKVQIKPGKPVAYGQVGATSFLGLPGNPVSSFIVFQLMAVPLMRALQGEQSSDPKAFTVKAGFDKPSTTREEYIRVRLEVDQGGGWVADRFANLSSGVLSSLSWADGLVRHNVGETIKTGQAVEFFPLREAML